MHGPASCGSAVTVTARVTVMPARHGVTGGAGSSAPGQTEMIRLSGSPGELEAGPGPA
jgi:hypothetical protein